MQRRDSLGETTKIPSLSTGSTRRFRSRRSQSSIGSIVFACETASEGHSEEGTAVDNAADELELIAVSKRLTRLLPHATAVRTNLEPAVQEVTPLKKI